MRSARTALGFLLVLVVLALGVTGGWAAGTKLQLSVDFLPLKFVFDGEEKSTPDGYFFNGVTKVPLGFIYEGTTYVPLRYVGEALGKQVTWDGTTQTIYIGSLPAKTAVTGTSPSPQSDQGLKLGDSTTGVLQLLGQPVRKDPGQGLEWWTYHRDYADYILLGIKNDKVVTYYTNSPERALLGLKAGSKRPDVEKVVELSNTYQFKFDGADFTMTQTAESLRERPVALVGDAVLQLFFDIHQGDTLTAFRVMDIATFLNYLPGGISLNWSYRSQPPRFGLPALTSDEEKALARGLERQIFDLTNALRRREGLGVLRWHEAAAGVARGHSQDMLENNFFAHDSPARGTLVERFKRAGISYRAVGENLAYGYGDAPSAHEGWMNSAGHRANILEEDWTHLGVGVAGQYFTQNFLR